MQRRSFVRAATAMALATPSLRLWAASRGVGPKFVLVFLRGGYDAHSLLVPHGSSLYEASRPGIAVPRPGSGTDGAIALDADWALNPRLRHSMLPLWARAQLAFVPFAGTQDMRRSHFEAQAHLERGLGIGARDDASGFLNRLAAQVGGGVRPGAFGARLPLSMRGDARVALAGADVPLDIAMGAASNGGLDPRDFAASARRAGAMLRDVFDIGALDVGGWDLHLDQAGINGAHGVLADRFAALGDGLASMARAMGPAWRDTTVVVLSEFGRTFRENGRRGTDHGHGSVYWVLGGAVRGRRIAGAQVAFTPANLGPRHVAPVLTDARALLGGVFARLWGLDARRIDAVFPGSQPLDLGLV